VGLTLRPATAADADALLDWRNDAQTRAMAISQEPVAPPDHRGWLRARLEDADSLLTIVEQDGVPVGTVRLDRRAPAEAELSITIAPGARGRGLARPAIELGVEHAGREWGVARVTARIRPENAASLRAFAAAGFAVEVAGGELLELARAV
jgi:RimJ/RimL family protein N-acetyltransferase